jgi:hypothetical protein
MNAGRGVLCAILLLAHGQYAIAADTAPTTARPTTQAAMNELVAAIAAQDTGRVLACFSKKGGWFLTTTAEGQRNRTRYTYVLLQQGLQEGGDFHDVLLGGSADDSLRDYIESTHGRAWKLKGRNTFVPPDDTDNVYVRWRREDGQYVVEEIAFPGA